MKQIGIDVAEITDNPRASVHCYTCITAVPAFAGYTPFHDTDLACFDLSNDWFSLISATSLTPAQAALIYSLEKNGKASIILPLLRTTHAHDASTVTALTNFYTTLYRPLMEQNADVRDLAAILRQVLSDTGVASLRFDAMDPTHPSFNMLSQALRQIGMVPFKFFGFGNWYLEAKNLNWETYFKQLPGKHRNTLKRLGRKFAEAGGEFKIAAGQGPDLEQAIQAYQTVYSASWKVPEPFPDFIPGFIRLCAQRGWLRLGLATLQGQPVAAQFWIVMQGKASIYKVSYDEKYSEFSPGSLLTGQMMQYVIEVDQVEEVDYLIGDDTYKKIWMSHRRERWGIVAYNPRTFKGLFGLSREMLGRSAKWVLKRVGVFRSRIQSKAHQ